MRADVGCGPPFDIRSRHGDDPLVARLERQPGRKEARNGQMLVDVEQAHARPLSDQTVPPEGPTLVGLGREVELLRGEVAELRTQVDGLRKGRETP